MKSLIYYIAIVLIFGGAWVCNFIKLTECDFISPYKCEAIHAVGLVPPLQIITVWFDFEEGE